MSIERCPLSQIPQDIIEGGPSLIIQVGGINFSVYLRFLVFKDARTL
jgi:hypothetical protein